MDEYPESAAYKDIQRKINDLMAKLSSLQTTEATSSTIGPRAPSQPSSSFFPVTRPVTAQPSPVPSASMMSHVSQGSNVGKFTAPAPSKSAAGLGYLSGSVSSHVTGEHLDTTSSRANSFIGGGLPGSSATDAPANLSNMYKLVAQAEAALAHAGPLTSTPQAAQSGLHYTATNTVRFFTIKRQGSMIGKVLL